MKRSWFRLGDMAPPEVARRAPRCWRKERWPTRGAAAAQMRSIVRRGLAKDEERIHVYQCPWCLNYHVGHERDSAEN